MPISNLSIKSNPAAWCLFFSMTFGGLVAVSHCQGQLMRKRLVIHFIAFVDDQPLVLGKTYLSPQQEPFSLSMFRFYVGDLFLSSATDSSPRQKGDYALVDFSNPSTCSLERFIEPGSYSGITFLLGVDSLHNVSGAQAGDLDPQKGMFWTWNSGYVTAKIEGQSPLSKLAGHAIVYHIGGYREPNVSSKTIHLPFTQGPTIVTQTGKFIEVSIAVNLNSWFRSPYPISFKTAPACTTPGPEAKQIADNYSHMFSLEAVLVQPL